MFLRHEGFLGAIGAFMSYEKHGLDDLMAHQFVERFPMGAPYVGGKMHGPPLGDLNEKARLPHPYFYVGEIVSTSSVSSVIYFVPKLQVC